MGHRSVCKTSFLPVTISLALAGWCSAIPGQAQTGRWSAPIVIYQGSSYSELNGSRLTTPWPVNGPLPFPSQYYNYGDIATVSLSGTITIRYVWVDEFGMPTTVPPPPDWEYLVDIADARWGFGPPGDSHALILAHAADNGLGNVEVLLDGAGTSHGSRVVRVPASAGVIERTVSINASLRLTCDFGSGFCWASVTFQAPFTAPAYCYDFSGYPPPSVVDHTTPYAQQTGNILKGPFSDDTGYYTTGLAFTNQTEGHALAALRSAGIVYVFGHGGSNFQSCQTFWHNYEWGAIVQTAAAKQSLINQGMNGNNIVVLNDEPNGSFSRLRLAVFEGCLTAYDTVSWGNPTDGVVAKGAKCAVGFLGKIFSDAEQQSGGKGAETWSTTFWTAMANGSNVNAAAAIARGSVNPGSGCKYPKIAGQLRTKIVPAGYAP